MATSHTEKAEAISATAMSADATKADAAKTYATTAHGESAHLTLPLHDLSDAPETCGCEDSPPAAWPTTPLRTSTLVVWAIFSTCALGLVLSGRISTYTQSFWHPILLAVSALVLICCLIALWMQLGTETTGRSHIGSLVIIPTLIVALCAPTALAGGMLATTTQASDSPRRGATAAAHTGGSPKFTPLDDGTANDITLENLSDRFLFGTPEDLDGKRVIVEGFISRSTGQGDAPGDGELFLNRFKIYCCAADAIAFGAILRTDPAAAAPIDLDAYDNDQWVRVEGIVDAAASSADDRAMVIITPTDITSIPAPKAPYL